jgi:AcrR family transcriptional regulator
MSNKSTWLDIHRRFMIHYVPASCSWLSPLSAGSPNRRIRRDSFLNVDDVIAAIEDFLAAWNEDQKPFGWTATADSIVAKLARCCQTLEQIQPGCTSPKCRRRLSRQFVDTTLVLMTQGHDQELDAILEALKAARADEVPDPQESLRERKKRRVRQRISDVATAMFIVHGFHKVTVAQIAAACEISQQTMFNYFQTKESMFLDHLGSRINAVADAVRDRGSLTLVDTVVQALAAGINPGRSWSLDEARHLHLLRLFFQAINSPSLAGRRLADFARFTEDMSAALAHRVHADPISPKVQLATFVIAGLVRVRQQSIFHHVQDATSLAALARAVRRDLLTAAHLAEPTLAAFDKTSARRA